MKLGNLIEGLDYKICGDINLELEVSGLCYDSRNVVSGDVFVCIEGFKTDGHKYAADAVNSGAILLVCAHEINECDIPYLICENTRHALAIMSANFYNNPSKNLKLIGVTGTNGKTSTTYMLKAIFEGENKKVGLIGTNQNMIGQKVLKTERTTPESLELQKLLADMLLEGVDIVVMEVSSHSLALGRVDGCDFDGGIFTNLSLDHLDFHSDMEDYLRAKAKLFGMCGFAVLNMDDERYDDLLSLIDVPVFTYSQKRNDADAVAKNIRQSEAGVNYELLLGSGISRVSLKIPGRFSVYNSMCAILCAVKMGVSLDTAKEALAAFGGVKGRAELVDIDAPFSVIIDYAHTPDGLSNIISTINEYKKGRLITLFGCGGDRDAKKRPQMGNVATHLSDECIITSDNPRSEDPKKIIADILEGIEKSSCPYTVIENRKDAIAYGLSIAKEDDILLLSGKGHETYQILSGGTIHFDEREIVTEEYKKIKEKAQEI